MQGVGYKDDGFETWNLLNPNPVFPISLVAKDLDTLNVTFPIVSEYYERFVAPQSLKWNSDVSPNFEAYLMEHDRVTLLFE